MWGPSTTSICLRWIPRLRAFRRCRVGGWRCSACCSQVWHGTRRCRDRFEQGIIDAEVSNRQVQRASAEDVISFHYRKSYRYWVAQSKESECICVAGKAFWSEPFFSLFQQ